VAKHFSVVPGGIKGSVADLIVSERGKKIVNAVGGKFIRVIVGRYLGKRYVNKQIKKKRKQKKNHAGLPPVFQTAFNVYRALKVSSEKKKKED
jgi:hypothetical protein